MRTTIRSERTFVPPVTAERSPPDSLMTGADSPVIADSSIEAIPSTISPSEGIRSLASQTTRSSFSNDAAATRSSLPFGRRRRASVSARIRLRVSAWALPRPSAIASAKLANATVRKSQMVMLQVKVLGCAIASKSTTTAPISTTNITGFLTWVLGLNFLIEPTKAWPRIWRSKRLRACATPWAIVGFVPAASSFVIPFACIGPVSGEIIRRTFRGSVARRSGRGLLPGRRSARR
jgi:hypothetical protein